MANQTTLRTKLLPRCSFSDTQPCTESPRNVSGGLTNRVLWDRRELAYNDPTKAQTQFGWSITLNRGHNPREDPSESKKNEIWGGRGKVKSAKLWCLTVQAHTLWLPTLWAPTLRAQTLPAPTLRTPAPPTCL